MYHQTARQMINDWTDRNALEVPKAQSIDTHEIPVYINNDGITIVNVTVKTRHYADNERECWVEEIIAHYADNERECWVEEIIAKPLAFDDLILDVTESLKRYGFKTVNF